MLRSHFTVVAILVLTGCATHPTISPLPLGQGESYAGYTLSAENVLPLVYYRHGLTDTWDLGLRVGLPIYGTGVDISRLLSTSEKRSDVLNLAYSFNPNHNVDLTYYRVKHKVKINEKKGQASRRIRYYGLRGMVIVSGMNGWRSNRFGILFGGAPAVKGPDAESLPRLHRYQWEIGYFHDFNSMPITSLFNPAAFDHTQDERYEDYPHSKGGLPSEYSRLTGLSFRISFPLGRDKAPPAPEDEDVPE